MTRAIGLSSGVVAVALFLACTAGRCEPRITMELKDTSVSAAIRTLFTKAGERCIIDGKVTGTITHLSLKDVGLQPALRAVLKGSNSAFEVRKGVYFIKPKPADPPKPAPAPPAAKKEAPPPHQPRQPGKEPPTPVRR